MGLTFRGLVLSDKVKGATAVACLPTGRYCEYVAMVGAKKLNEMRLNPCRSVVNNFSMVKTEGWAVLQDKA
jgi:hypothetical protein